MLINRKKTEEDSPRKNGCFLSIKIFQKLRGLVRLRALHLLSGRVA